MGNFRFEDMEGPLALAPERIGTCVVCEPIWGLKWANTVTHLLKRSAVAGLVLVSFAGGAPTGEASRHAARSESSQATMDTGK